MTWARGLTAWCLLALSLHALCALAQPDAPLPPPNQTTINLRGIAPLSTEPAAPEKVSPALRQVENSKAKPQAESPSALNTYLWNLIGAYRASRVPDLMLRTLRGLDGFVHDGKLYLSLHDAIELAIENNLDVEVSRYNLLFANTDIARAQGGGNLRGIDFTIQQPPPGVGAATSPLLITESTANASSTNASVTDLSQVTQIGNSTQVNLSENETSSFSPGPPIPLYDPNVIGEISYFRRSNQVSLLSSGASAAPSNTTGSSGISSPAGSSDFLSTGIEVQQGFSTGAQLEAYVDNASEALYGTTSQYDPFSSPTVSVTLTQPLLRGRGRNLNLRFIRIAKINQQVSDFYSNSNCSKRFTVWRVCITTWFLWARTLASSRNRSRPRNVSTMTTSSKLSRVRSLLSN